MEKEKLQNLKRVIANLSDIEAKRVIELFENGQKTGYATIDKPWDEFYKNSDENSLFLNTTPYQGLVLNNINYPNEIALEYFGAKITFGELIKNIDKVAKSLEEYGIKKGDFITICSTTTPEVVYAFYAVSKLGAVANVISPFYEPKDFMNRINECESNMIIMVDKFIPKFKDVLNKRKNANVVVLPMMNSSLLRFISKRYKIDGTSNEVLWKQFVKDGSLRDQTILDPYEINKPQAMVYSSGTTGASKGILLSVDSFQKLINAYGNSGFDTSRLQKVYQNIPPWHSTGLSLGINFPLSYGVKVCTDPRFEHDVFIKNVLKFKPEYILTNTSMYQGFTFEKSLKRLKGKSLSFLKYPVEGGEPLTERDIRNIEEVFRNNGSTARLLNGYGECECGATITTDITGHKFSNDASGIPLPNITTIGIFDDEFNELKYGERGNVVARTEIGMLEYFKNPEATEKFFYVDENGTRWSQTGDVGYINEDGSLVVLGRKSDYSIIDDTKIYNFDIERAILKTGTVKLCEIQTHPENDNELVAHIVWENEISSQLEQKPELLEELLKQIQNQVSAEIGIEEAIPFNFCIRDSFPSAHSGKRDIKFIKSDIEGLIRINNKSKKLIR